jgi:uncharacterized protein YbjT (DUF2867 family)
MGVVNVATCQFPVMSQISRLRRHRGTHENMLTIAVAGGTGTLGRRVTEGLRSRGHDVRVLSCRSPDYRVDLTTGEGLAAALAGCDVVVDASNDASKHAAHTLVEGRLEVAGPEVADARDLARTWRSVTGWRALLLPVPLPGRLGRALGAGVLTTGRPDVSGTTGFAAWLEAVQRETPQGDTAVQAPGGRHRRGAQPG